MAETGNGSIVGLVDGIEGPNAVRGWAYHVPSHRQVAITVKKLGKIVGKAHADQHRPELTDINSGYCGFIVCCEESILAGDLLCGAVEVSAADEDGNTTVLSLWTVFQKDLALQALTPLLSGIDDGTMGWLLPRMQNLAATMASYPKLRAYLQVGAGGRSLETPAGFADVEPEGLTELKFIPGIRSLDGTALVGHGGHLFLTEGSNAILAQYSEDKSVAESRARAWAEIIDERRRAFDVRGVRYLQMIVPEKITALGKFFPEHLTTPTPCLKMIEEIGNQFPDNYLPLVDFFREDPQVERTFMRTDTHISSYGAMRLFQRILQAFKQPFDVDIVLDDEKVFSGDLGRRIFGTPVYEVYDSFSSEMEAKIGQAKIVSEYVPPDNRHIGRRKVWENPRAPIDAKVVAFANSFFDFGWFPRELSWWCSRWFREFHFIWSPEVDYTYVDMEKPNVVICQTIERFLPQVAKS